jgi:hypothetical protein
MVRGFITREIPPFSRILLIESGSRHLLERLIPRIYTTHGDGVEIDLVTCYAGIPEGFRGGRVFRVSDYGGAAGRARLYGELRAGGYTIMGIICSAEPILFKWKLAFMAKVPAKVFILNENGDYFWFQRSDWKILRHFLLYRTGLSGAGAVRAVARLVLFPVTVIYLILYAAVIHLRRKAHS